jgi:hypothetical protein
MKISKKELKLIIEEVIQELSDFSGIRDEMEDPLLLEVKSLLESIGLPVAINTGVQDVKNQVLVSYEPESVNVRASYNHVIKTGAALASLMVQGYEVSGTPQLGFGEVLFIIKRK